MFADVSGDLKNRIWKRRLFALTLVVAVVAAVVYFRMEYPDNFNQTVDITMKTFAEIKTRLF